MPCQEEGEREREMEMERERKSSATESLLRLFRPLFLSPPVF